MAVITTSTFEPLNRYVRVRLAQGVPIVDADVNEREDISMFELRAFLKWFVGDGVPEGNDAFRIRESAVAKANNFTIASGFGTAVDGLHTAGRCLVNGLDVMIRADEEFTNQDLIETRADIVAREARFRAPRILVGAINAVAATTLHVWLDVWDALWTASDDPALIPLGLGTESCARERRYWAVRVRTSAAPPAVGDPEFAAGHSYYRIATLTRRATDQNVLAADITDLREQRLLMPPSTIIPDLFGTPVLDYRRGLGRPPISFRTAINALIRGEIPATPELVIANAPGFEDSISRGIFFLGSTIVLTWTSDRAAGRQIWGATLDTATPGAAFASVQPLTAGADHQLVHAVPLRIGDVLLLYETLAAPLNEDVHYKRWTPPTPPPAADLVVAATGGVRERRPFGVPVGPAAGEQVIVMWHDQSVTRWLFNRYDVNTNAFAGASAQLSPSNTSQLDLHATKDAADTIWAAFTVTAGATNEIRAVQLPAPYNAPVEAPFSTANTDRDPFVLIDTANVAWVFWVSTAGGAGGSQIMYTKWNAGAATWEAAASIPNFPPGAYVARAPTAVTDADGAIWVFWDNFLSPGGNKDIWFARLDPVSGVWTGTRPTTGTAEADQSAVVLSRRDGILWLFWNRVLTATGRTELFFRRLITTI